MLVEFGLDRGEVARMWRLIVAMAVRDGAVSVHWHPWRAADALAYVVGGVRHSLGRPPVVLDPVVSAATRELITGGGMWSALGRRLGWPAAGRFGCTGAGGPSEWCGVLWSAGGVCGADLHRLDVAVAPVVEVGLPNPTPQQTAASTAISDV
jgi:hypothetical protein